MLTYRLRNDYDIQNLFEGKLLHKHIFVYVHIEILQYVHFYMVNCFKFLFIYKTPVQMRIDVNLTLLKLFWFCILHNDMQSFQFYRTEFCNEFVGGENEYFKGNIFD